eukprot:5952573-Lingulodinium_polyedra.AAC.1
MCLQRGVASCAMDCAQRGKAWVPDAYCGGEVKGHWRGGLLGRTRAQRTPVLRRPGRPFRQAR